MDLSIYGICYTVLIYGFIGWCIEVIYAAVNRGKFVNRGFMNGPVCPIYGFGMLTVLAVLNGVRDNILLLFICGTLLTSALELITGYLLEKFFSAKWWDYSGVPFNICGYVCLKFSLLWGLGVVFAVNVVNPPIAKLILALKGNIGTLILIIMGSLFMADFIITVIGILKLPARLKSMEELEEALKKVSDSIGEKLYEGTSAAIKKDEIFQKKAEKKRTELSKKLDTLESKYKDILSSHSFVSRRILVAFPTLNIKGKSVKKLIKKLKR